MFSRVLRALFGSRRRAGLVVVLWILLIGALTQLAPALGEVEDNGNANDPPSTSASMRAANLAAAEFPRSGGTPAIIIVRSDSATVTRTTVAEIGEQIDAGRAGDLVRGHAITSDAAGGSHLRNAEGTAEMMIVPIQGNPSDEAFQDTVAQLRALTAGHAAGAEVAVTGPAGIATDTIKAFSSGDKVLLFGTIALVVILLLLIYRSPVLVVVALAGVGVAMRLAETVGASMAEAGWFDISSQTASIMTVLLFGVGTDYALIVTSRYREALASDRDHHSAMVQAMRGVTGAIASSVSTIVLAMLALLAAVTPVLRGFGPYLAIGVASMALVAFTFTPALMLLFGDKAFWPTTMRTATRRTSSNVWARIATVVVRSPRTVIASTLAALAVMSAGLIGYAQTYDFIGGFRVDTESATGQQIIAESFGPGEIAPATIYVSATDRGVPTGQWAGVGTALSRLDGIARVGDTPVVSKDGSSASFEIVFADDPYGNQALDRIAPLTQEATAIAKRAGITQPEVLIGGETAKATDTRTSLDRDLTVIVVLVLLIVAGVLALLLRSLLAPLYLVATLLLSFTATLGVTTFATITLLGDEGLGSRVAVYIFVFLVALGVDYNIFIMSRYRQELAEHTSAEAIRIALTRTGGVISSAGLILAAVFAVLMTQPIRELFQFGFAMAFGILLDTFVIRPLLVPAIIQLLGDKALWPSVPQHSHRRTESSSP